MKYLILSFILIGCSSVGTDESNDLTIVPATKCTQLTGTEKRVCGQPYKNNSSDYEEVMTE
jgi:hypothetical protein